MEEEFETPKVNFVPCLKIVKQGVSKSNPIQVITNRLIGNWYSKMVRNVHMCPSFFFLKIQLSRAELGEFIKKEQDNNSDDDDDDDEENQNSNPVNKDDEFDMEHYNDEG